jgi:hypothetical protein
LSDPNPRAHSAAAKALAGLGRDAVGAVPLLLELQKQDNQDVRANALSALRGLGKEDTVPALLALLGAKGPLRDVAAYALGEVGADAKAVAPRLKEAARDPDERVRTATAVSLYRLERSIKPVLPQLLAGAGGKDSFAKRIAASALADAVFPLKELFKDKDEKTRKLALLGLRVGLTSFEGRQAIYREGGLLARVRLKNIRVDEKGVSAEVVPIPTPGLTARKGWDIYAAWSIFSCHRGQWHAIYVSWTISFDDRRCRAIEAVIGDASLDDAARARKIQEIVFGRR